MNAKEKIIEVCKHFGIIPRFTWCIKCEEEKIIDGNYDEEKKLCYKCIVETMKTHLYRWGY